MFMAKIPLSWKFMKWNEETIKKWKGVLKQKILSAEDKSLLSKEFSIGDTKR